MKGLAIVCICLFILSWLIMKMRVINNKIISQRTTIALSEGNKSIKTRLEEQKLIVLVVIMFCCLINPWALIPYFSYQYEYQGKVDAAFTLTLLLGFTFGGAIFFLLYQLKKQFPDYQKSLVPGVIIYLWLFAYIPFLSLLPYLNMIVYGDEDYISERYQIYIGLASVLIVTGIACLFLLIEVYFMRYVYENQIKYVCCKLMKMLEQQHVKSDFESMRIAYEYYLQNGYSDTQNNILLGNPIRYIKISKFSPETEFSKLIISQELYTHLRKRRSQKKKLKGQSFLKKWFSICFECKDDAFDQLNGGIKKRQIEGRQLKSGVIHPLKRIKKRKQKELKSLGRTEYIQREFNKEADKQEQKILEMEQQLESNIQSSELNEYESIEEQNNNNNNIFQQAVQELPLQIQQNEKTESESEDEDDDDDSYQELPPILKNFKESEEEDSSESEESSSDEQSEVASNSSSLVNALQELMEQQRIEHQLQEEIELEERKLKENKEAEKVKEKKEKKEKKQKLQKEKIKKKIVIKKMTKVIKVVKIKKQKQVPLQKPLEQKEEPKLILKPQISIIPQQMKIPDSIINAVSFHDQSQSLGADSSNSREKFFQKMFKLYCSKDGIINYVEYKDMLRESGVVPCYEIQDFQIDLVYSNFTVKRNSDVIIRISEDRLVELLTAIAILKFPEMIKFDAFIKLLRMYIWPYLLLRRKEIQIEYPGEYEYLKFLLNKANINEDQFLELSQQEKLQKQKQNEEKRIAFYQEQEKNNQNQQKQKEEQKLEYESESEEEQEIEEEEEVEEEISDSSVELEDEESESEEEEEEEEEVLNEFQSNEEILQIEQKKKKLQEIEMSRQENQERIQEKEQLQKDKKAQWQQQQQLKSQRKQKKEEDQRLREEQKKKKQEDRSKRKNEWEKQVQEREEEIQKRNKLKEEKAKQKEEKKKQKEEKKNQKRQQKIEINDKESIKLELKNKKQIIPDKKEEQKKQQNNKIIKQNDKKKNVKKAVETEKDKKSKKIKLLSIGDTDNQAAFNELNPEQKEAVLEYYDSDDESLDDEKFTAFQKPSCCKLFKNCIRHVLQGIIVFPKTLCYIENQPQNEWAKDQLQTIHALHLPKNSTKVFRHAQSPDWPTITKLIVDHIPFYQEAFIKMGMTRTWVLQSNLMNIIGVIFRIIELFSIASLAFAPYIDWGFSQITLNFLNSTNGEISQDQYEILQINFWVAIGLVCGLIFLLFIAMYRVRNKLYGTKPGFTFIFDAILIHFFIILSQTFYIFIMKSLVNAYSCNYQKLPWRVYADTAMICYSEQHHDYIFGTAFALFAYYPITTFFYPNFQFYNTVLTLKYERGWIIMNSSLKFILIGLTTFFKTHDGITISFIFSTILLFLAAIIFTIYEPCKYQVINRLESGGYFLLSWCYFCSLLVHTTEELDICFIILLIGIFVITITTIQGTLNEHFSDLREETVEGTEEDLKNDLFNNNYNKVVKTEEDEAKKFYAKDKRFVENNVVKCNTEENYNTNNNINTKISASLISKFGQFSAMFKKSQSGQIVPITVKKATFIKKDL